MKKVFNVHFSVPASDKTEVKFFVADTYFEVLNSIPDEEYSRVAGITTGPSVEVL